MKQLSIIAQKDKIIEQLLLENKSTKEANTLLSSRLEKSEENNKLLNAKLESVQFQLDQLVKLIYGRKSEKLHTHLEDTGQLELFDALHPHEQETSKQENQSVTYQRKKTSKKKKPVRGALPEHLERKIHKILPEGDLSNMVKIGEEATEELEYEPAKLFVNCYIVEKYTSKTPSKDGSCKIIKGVLPSRPIEKGIPGPSLLAHLIVSKFADHLPVYRQQQIFRRQGCELAENTMYGWFTAIGRVLEPLYEELKKDLFASDYIMADETPIRVLDKNKKRSTHRGWHWVYYSPLTGQVCFDYRKGRGREGPIEVLEGFKGYLQTDGYNGYDIFKKYKNIKLLGCMAHARRKFIEAEKQDPTRAKWMLKNMQTLYGIEKICREKKLNAQKIQNIRLRFSSPILSRIKKWLLDEYQKVTPKSAIGKAIAYSLQRWDKLSLYVIDGILQIDNNLVENQIRVVALGRKNYLFAGSHQAAKDAAIYYSLLGSCKQKGINPTEYLKKILTVIHDTKINNLASLLPKNIEL